MKHPEWDARARTSAQSWPMPQQPLRGFSLLQQTERNHGPREIASHPPSAA